MSRETEVGRGAAAPSRLRGRATAGCRIAIIAMVAAAAASCGVTSSSERLSQARRLSADLLVQFTKADDAANRAVMADTDEASVAFAREAEQATQGVLANVDVLQSILRGLDYTDETRLLQTFGTRFAAYRELDRRILGLAVENTNLKAQRLSFGSAQEAANAFRDSLGAVGAAEPKDTWRVRAIVATAVADVRQIQVLQAPHVADSDAAVMTRIEKEMDASAGNARHALETLAPLIRPASRTQLTAAGAALDRFMDLNAQIVALSRRNTNVRSLALVLNEKGKLTAACEDSLRALREALATRGFTGTR